MKRVLNSYTKFAKSIDVELKCKKSICDWFCLSNDKVVYIPRLITEQGEIEFLENVRKLLPNQYKSLAYDVSNFMWFFLHEVGHCETEEETPLFATLRKIVDFIGRHGLLSTKLLNTFYFHFPAEKNATLWAIDYVINNLEKVKKAEQKIERAYVNYFDRLGVSLED